MVVKSWIYGSGDECNIVFGEYLAQMVHTALGRNHGNHDETFGSTLCEESLVGQFHTLTGGQHGIYDDERLTLERRCGEILDIHAYVGAFPVEIVAIGRHKGVACVVEEIEEALVQRQPGTEYGTENDILSHTLHLTVSDGSLYDLRLIFKEAAHLISLNVAYAAYVLTEAQTVVLDFHIAYL